MDPKPLLITLLCICVSAEWNCTTYDGNNGQCINLDQCAVLNSMLTKRDKTFYETLKKYTCGFDGNNPKVCCPEEINTDGALLNGKDCITPDGDVGTCTKLQDCSSIMANQLNNKEFVSPDNMDFVKRSKCTVPGSSTSSYVCCKTGLDSRAPDTTFYGGTSHCVLTAFPPELDSNCCGIESTSDPRIIGGQEAEIDQFPWLVVIDYTRIGFSCGGSLISGRYVLTAAHCLVGSKGRDRQASAVRVGEYNTTNEGPDCISSPGGGEDCTEGAISIPIESFVVHEQYDADNVLQYHDIALIRLSQTVKYTEFIRPICLPRSDFTTLSTVPDLFIAGWGIFDERQQETSVIKLFAKVPYVRKEQCNQQYKKFGRQSLVDTQLCVGGEADRDSCKGDSGGPLMLQKELTFEAVGVISFGTSRCGLENWPSIYTKVYDYMDWIMSKIKP